MGRSGSESTSVVSVLTSSYTDGSSDDSVFGGNYKMSEMSLRLVWDVWRGLTVMSTAQHDSVGVCCGQIPSVLPVTGAVPSRGDFVLCQALAVADTDRTQVESASVRTVRKGANRASMMRGCRSDSRRAEPGALKLKYVRLHTSFTYIDGRHLFSHPRVSSAALPPRT